MKIKGEYTFDASPEKVWDGLMNPEVMAATIPGAEKFELVGENHFASELTIKVGPVQGHFRGRIQLEDIDSLNSYTMKVDGQGPQGFVKAKARIAIVAQEKKTLMTYDADAQVGGRIVSVGQRLMESSGKAIIRKSLEGLNTRFSAQNTEQMSSDKSEKVPEIITPSQTAFAAEVTKEVVRDLVPTPIWVGLGILLLGFLFYLIQ